MAQLVARYLGVVEAASSSLVTQTKIGNRKIPDFSLYTEVFQRFSLPFYLFMSTIKCHFSVKVLTLFSVFFPRYVSG